MQLTRDAPSCVAELVAANRTSSVAAGLVAFVLVAIGFLVASGLWIAYRVHWEKTRWAAFVEDTATPVPTGSNSALTSCLPPDPSSASCRPDNCSFWPRLETSVPLVVCSTC